MDLVIPQCLHQALSFMTHGCATIVWQIAVRHSSTIKNAHAAKGMILMPANVVAKLQ